ncbi:hemagglutinin repeat-containing protein, partial [Campylobacter showae]
DIKIYANNININPVAYESLEYSQTNKKGFGGFKRSLDIHSLAKLSLAGSSLTTTSGNISLNANNDISIVSSNVNSASILNLSAPNTISIIAAKEQSKEVSIHKSSKFNPLGTLANSGAIGTGSGEIYTVNYNEQGSLDGLSKLSNISAKDNINLNTSDATITANLSSDKNIDIKANSTSILNATNTHENYSISNSKSISISKLQDILKESKPKSISELKKDTSVKLRVADAKYKKATNNASSLKSISSTLNADNISIETNEDISITGSDLNAKEDISIISKNGNIYISNSTDTLDTTSALKQAEAALSLTVQNEYAQVAPAAIALAEAIKQLKNVKKEYDEYKKQKSNLSSKLSELKQRYKNKEVGVDASDIEDLTDILDNIKDEEKYYITNIALATTNVASKTTALVSQAAAAASSSVTYGFSAGVAADVSGTQTNSKTKQTVSTPSNLTASNIRLTTNKDKDASTNITGSNLLASNNIDINTKDLNINSSKDTFELDEKSKAISGSVKFTMYGGGGGSA